MQPVYFLAMAILSLFAAPLIHRTFRTRPNVLRGIEVVSVSIVLLIVLLHILPESISDAGWPAVLLVGVGLVVPLAVEKFCTERLHDVHHMSLVIVIIGLAIHSLMDGAAIAAPQGSHHLMAWAVVAHRVPDGLFIWCMLFPRYGFRKPFGALLTVAATTTAGFVIGLVFLTDLEGNFAIGLFQAFVAGSLLHVIVGHRLFPSLHRHAHHGADGCETEPGFPAGPLVQQRRHEQENGRA